MHCRGTGKSPYPITHLVGAMQTEKERQIAERAFLGLPPNPEAPTDGLNDHWHEPPPKSGWWWVTVVVWVLLFALLVWLFTPANARDLGQWKDVDPQISAWYARLMQPDTIGQMGGGISCCGEADAYWADEVEVKDGQMIAVITDDRDDKPLGRVHEEIGTRYVVPPNKITRQDGNPTGHVIIFLGDGRAAPRSVLCYVMNGGV